MGEDFVLQDLINRTQPVSYPRAATITAATCAILFIVIGVVGNLITITALVRCPKLRGNATNAFILSLCVSDLLFCSINLPLTASRYIYESWEFGHVLCQLFPLILYGNVAVSLLSMVAITINRYILIAYYDKYTTIYSVKNIWIQLFFIWSIAFGLMIPPLLGVWGRLGLDPATFSCTILKANGASPKKFLFLVGFALPCLVIIISYSCIYWRVRKSKRNLEAHGQLQSNGSSCSVREREDTRLTALMLCIFLCFLVCFLPLMIMNVADDDIKYPVFHVIASIAAWASSVINPLIYAATNRQYRAAYKELFNVFTRDHNIVKRTTGASKTFCQPSTNNSGQSQRLPIKSDDPC